MIPPKIKKLPNLHKPQTGYIQNPQQGSSHANKGGFVGSTKMLK
jgi:hypothetical protein